MDENYFKKIKEMQDSLPNVSVVNMAPELFCNIIKSYNTDQIRDLMNYFNFVLVNEGYLHSVYAQNFISCKAETENRTLFMYFKHKNIAHIFKCSLS